MGLPIKDIINYIKHIKNDKKIWNNWKSNKTFFITYLHNYWFEKYRIDADYSIIEIK